MGTGSMIEGRIIVCLASSWDYDPTSKHQIMRILSQRNDILWVNYRGTRTPTTSAHDLRECFSTMRRVLAGPQRISDSMVQVTPMVIPGARGRLSRWIHQRMLVSQIKRAIKSISGSSTKPIQVWTFAPDVPYLVGEFDEERFIYYCVDEYTKFDGFNQQAIAAIESELIDRADIVVATSQPLHETKSKQRSDIALMRHGVDFGHFAQAWRKQLKRPADLAGITKPILGFFGLIHHWIDLKLIADVAQIRPEYDFVMIGDCIVDDSPIAGIANIHQLGRREYADLPAYCQHFSAGLMPFASNEMTPNINPIKMAEYLAAGLPVVSTDLPEARRYAGPISIASTAEGFAKACDEAVARRRLGQCEAISMAVADCSWEAVVEDLSTLVMNGPHASDVKTAAVSVAKGIDSDLSDLPSSAKPEPATAPCR